MKIIEGLKLQKELIQKAADLRTKIGQHSAYVSVETPVYADQPAQVRNWLKAHEDITEEIAKLHVRVSKTNFATPVTINVGGENLTKSITEWVIRRRLLAEMDMQAWASLTDRNLKEGQINSSLPGAAPVPVKIVRCYDPLERDNKKSVFQTEPGLIDRTMEVVNATTDLLAA